MQTALKRANHKSYVCTTEQRKTISIVSQYDKLGLFDKTVLPIMLYECEIWGYGDNYLLDAVLLKFCKYVLGLKPGTPNRTCMTYGEL